MSWNKNAKTIADATTRPIPSTLCKERVLEIGHRPRVPTGSAGHNRLDGLQDRGLIAVQPDQASEPKSGCQEQPKVPVRRNEGTESLTMVTNHHSREEECLPGRQIEQVVAGSRPRQFGLLREDLKAGPDQPRAHQNPHRASLAEQKKHQRRSEHQQHIQRQHVDEVIRLVKRHNRPHNL